MENENSTFYNGLFILIFVMLIVIIFILKDQKKQIKQITENQKIEQVVNDGER